MNPLFQNSLAFELAYLATLTREGLKPLSRWEKEFDCSTDEVLQALGLKTCTVVRSVRSGQRVRELLFSTSERCLANYATRFAGTPVNRCPETMRIEGRLFGYPACCVENYISRGYARNSLRRRDQRILFHWACPQCGLTPLLLPDYRRIYRECRQQARGRGSSRSGLAWPQAPSRLKRTVALAASVATLGTLSLLGAFDGPKPDPHWLALQATEDPDADLLTTPEEVIVGKDPANPDQNSNGQPDGPDLALALSALIDALPTEPSTTQPYLKHHMAFGLENCQVCGAVTNMGSLEIINPLENQSVAMPYVAKHFLEHGGFSYVGTNDSGILHSGRISPALLQTVLTSAGLAHFLHEPAISDRDDDGLRDWEEAAFGCEPRRRDTDGDQLVDGIDTARALRTQLEALPRAGSAEQGPKDRPFIVEHPMDGVETCPHCGGRVVMGIWDVINPIAHLSLCIPSMALHHLEHGGMSWRGGQLMGGQGRVDPLQLKAVLSGQGGGHLLPVTPDADLDLLTDAEEQALGTNPQVPDEDANQVADGIDLARRTAGEIAVLPVGPGNAPVYRFDFPLRGLERCDICGTNVNMGHLTVCYPEGQLNVEVPYIALHYLEHGSFSFAGDVHGKGRSDVRLLTEALHGHATSHLIVVASDSDQDGLLDTEEAHLGTRPDLADTDGDGVLDGMQMARRLHRRLQSLPVGTTTIGQYRVPFEANCFAPCPVCGESLNCGHEVVTNAWLGLSLQISYMNLHFLQQGSFAVSAGERVDPILLEKLLQPPVSLITQEIGTILRWFGLPGHTYQIHTATSLDGPWTTGPSYSGSGTELTFTDTEGIGQPRRFYQLRKW